MEIRREIRIAKDRLAVWRAFDDPEKRRQWQKGLDEIENVYGEPGRPGSVTQYLFHDDGDTEVVEETVLERKPPGQYVARYHNSKDARHIKEQFETIGGNQTRWVRVVNVRAHTLVKRVLNYLFKGGIESEVEAEMDRFKEMVESGG